MNPSPTVPVNRSSGKRFWITGAVAVLLLTGVVLLPVMLVAGLTSYFRLGSDTKALRNALVESSGIPWHEQFEFNLGGFTFGVARIGLSFAHPGREVSAALKTVRGVEVALCQLPSDAVAPDRAAMLASADTAMKSRGWSRLVGVLDGQDLVAVYMPDTINSVRQMKCSVLVFDGQQLILASVRANPEPLIQCLLDQPDVRTELKSLTKL